MNVAEAAKAFLAAAYPETKAPMKGVVFNGEKFVYELDGREAYTNNYFTLFCAGIAHAEEMAKPAVTIRNVTRTGLTVFNSKGDVTFFTLFGGGRNGDDLFKTREAAVKWAVANGYRVLD